MALPKGSMARHCGDAGLKIWYCVYLLGFCPGLQSMAYSRSSVSEDCGCLRDRISVSDTFMCTEGPWGEGRSSGSVRTKCCLLVVVCLAWQGRVSGTYVFA